MSDNKGRSGGHDGFVTCARCGVKHPATGEIFFANPQRGQGWEPIKANETPLGHGCAALMVQHEAGTMLVAAPGSDYCLSLYRFIDDDGAPARLRDLIAPICDACIRFYDEAKCIELISHE